MSTVSKPWIVAEPLPVGTPVVRKPATPPPASQQQPQTVTIDKTMFYSIIAVAGAVLLLATLVLSANAIMEVLAESRTGTTEQKFDEIEKRMVDEDPSLMFYGMERWSQGVKTVAPPNSNEEVSGN